MSFSRSIGAAAAGALILLAAAGSARAKTVVKFATLAPKGSTWMNVMEEWNRDLVRESGGELEFRFYSGGVSGDEKDVVRKLRLGQIQAAGFTGVGLGEIAPEVRLLDAPFLFRNPEEVDRVRAAFDKEWNSAFEAGGTVLLGWADVGFVYFFTNTPVRDLRDLKDIKMWMWEGDPIAEAAFKTIGVSPIPLSVTDVMTSLQTGLIDGDYSSPLAAIALQWFTRVKFMYGYQLANASGAVLVSKRFFDSLPESSRGILRRTGRKHLALLTGLTRKEDLESVAVLKKSGITVTPLDPPELLRAYEELGRSARRLLAGRLYSLDLLEKLEKTLERLRSNPGK